MPRHWEEVITINSKLIAVLIVAGIAAAVALVGSAGQVEYETPQTADASSALANLSTTLESLIDPIVTLATIVIVFALVMGVLSKIKGWFKF